MNLGTSHPSDDDLACFNRGETAADKLDAIGIHLDICPECVHRLEALSATDHVLTWIRKTARPSSDSQFVSPADATLKNGLPDTRPSAPVQLGDYEILAEVGRGGMGVVYKARQKRLNRLAAVKTILTHEHASADQMLRFQREAEMAARVRHPNVVQIYEVGTHCGRPFIAMEWIEGPTLAKQLEDRPLSPPEAAQLTETLALAVQAAHSQGVVHRDLKPANILLQIADCKLQIEMQSAICNLRSAIPKITDFGLARPLQGDGKLTQTGAILGTPEYMAPEQARGGDSAGPPADVYGLGVILYKLLTGRPPFRTDSAVETLRQVVELEPVAPRLLNNRIPRDLETVCLKCLEKRPERRYPTAGALAEDLRRFFDHRPIRARRIGALGRLARWSRRNPGVAALLAGILTIFLTAFALVSWSYWRAEDALQESHRRERAERWQRYRGDMAATAIALQLQNVGAARRALETTPQEYRDWEWHHFYHQLDSATHVAQGSAGPVNWMRFVAGGKQLVSSDGEDVHLWDAASGKKQRSIPNVVVNNRRAAVSPDGATLAHATPQNTIVLWNLVRDQVHRVLRGHERGVKSIRFSSAGTRLVSNSDDGTVRVWDTNSGEQLLVLTAPTKYFEELGISPDGRRLAASMTDGLTVYLWDAQTGKRLAALDGHETGVTSIAFNPANDQVASTDGYPSNVVRLWHGTGQPQAVLRGHENEISMTAFSPDGKRLASASYDQTIRLWDAATGNLVAVLKGHTGWVTRVEFSPDSQRLISGSQDRSLRLWNGTTGAPLAVLRGHTGAIDSVAYSPDGGLVAAGSIDRAIRFWDMRLVERQGVLRGHTRFVYGAAFHPDGDRVASAAWDGTVRIWNATTGEQTAQLPYGDNAIVTSVAFHPAGRLLATVGRENAVRLWDLPTGRELHRWPVPTDNYRDFRVAFNPAGNLLAAGSKDGVVYLWDVESRAEVAALKGHTNMTRDVAFSPDGRWLASASDDKTVRIWDVTNKEPIAVLDGHAETVYCLAFHGSEKLLASGSNDGTVRLWDTNTWKETGVLKHGTNIYGVAFHPAGTRLAAACADNTIRLWDVATRQEVTELRGHTAYVHAIAFSPDGTRLVSASGDFTLRVWDTLSVQKRANGGERQ
jgi:WD40 repeat protein/tRNA A-37 threonylcarbamoyl transferase component Bud32